MCCLQNEQISHSNATINIQLTMGCCVSQQDYRRARKESKRESHTADKIDFGWNMEQLQAEAFAIDEANIKLKAQQRLPHRICSKQAFPDKMKFIVKIRYVHLSGNGAFAVGIFHYRGGSQAQRIERVGVKNSTRLFVSTEEGQVQSEGRVELLSKEWKTKQQDTVVLSLNMSTQTVEWKKENTMETVNQKTVLPMSFGNKQLYLELIMYEPDTQLNIQTGGQE